MENNTELEEGEAFSYKDDDEDNIYLDSLSYIDERIQHVLGHFQKDFEGGVTAENLGSKYGSYGSFLPTYERSCVESHPKTPQRNHCSPNSPINLHKEVASRRLKAPSIAPPSRLGTSSYSSYLIHNVRTPSVDGSVKKEGMISSSEVADRSTIKDDTTKKSGNSNDQRTLKLRFKMKSNIFAQKNGAIYSGLGLDNSPSSSMGNSPVESEGMATVSKENVNDSPAVIIQVMTSFPIPRGVLTSPLPESMLYLIKKENVIGDCRYMSSANGNQEPSSMYTGESDSLVGDGHLRKKVRIGKLSEKQLELKHMNGVLSENDMTLHSKKILGNTIPDCKEIISNDLKFMALSSSVFDAGGITKVTGKASEVSKEVNKGRMEGRMVSVGAVKQESLESISGQGFDKIGKQRAGNGFIKNILENELENPYKDNFRVPKNNDKCNDTSMISEKVECDAVKCKADQNPQKYETNQKKKTLSEGKNKSKVSQSLGKAESVARKDSFGCTNNPKVTDKESADIYVTSGRSKMNKTKSLKDNKVRDSNRDSLKEKKSEWKVDGPPGNSAIKNANIDNFVKQSAFGAKIKKRPSVNKVDDQLLAEPCTKDASGSFPIVENELVPEMIRSAVAAPQLIAEDWVCCDSCEKWRLLPTGIKTEQLPEKWLCSMQNWLPGMNLCDISEEETTNALYASYQIPISEGKNNIQSHAAGLASGVSSDAVQIGLNQEKSNSNVLSIRGKKRHAIKEKTMLEFNNRMINAQESGKIISLTDMNQHPEDSNPMKHMTSKHFSMYNKLIEERHVAKDIQKQINGGDKKLIKLKRKMDTDQYRSGTPKKSKTEDVCYAKKLLKPSMSIDKVGLKSRNGQPAKASGMDMQKYDNYCLPEDVEDKLLDPVKKDGDQSLSDDGSFDVKHGSKNDVSVKKRKFKDWVDNEKHDDSFSLQGDKQCGKEGNASGFRKEKKSRILNTEAKSVMEADDKLNKGGMTHACLSGCRGQMDVGTKVKFVDKAQQPKKHRVNTASHKSSDGIGQLGKDFGSGQLSLAPTSSSSKVLGSNRAKANLEDVIGSPVESVTSSSLRTSKLNKHILAVGGISGRDDASKGGLSSIGSRRSADNTEGMLSVKLKDRISHNLHPACHNVSIIEYRVEDVKDKARVRAKTSEVKNDHLFEGGVPVEQCGSCTNAMHHEEKVDKNNQESKLSWQKSGNVTSLHGKEKDWMSGSKVGKDKMKLSALENDYSKNGGRHGSTVDPSYHAYVPETKNNAKCSSPKSKHEIDNISQKNALRHGSSETGKKTKVKQKDLESSVLKMDAQCRTDRWNISQQNLIQGPEDENEANYVYPESRDGKSLVLTSSVSEVKSEALYVGSRTEPGFQKGGMNNELPVHVSGNGDVAKTMIKSVDLSSNVGVNYNPEKVPDQHLIVSSPMQTKSSQTASNMLEEATKLKDRADHYKSSGFEFESNETYFDAALKFLHGASLVENCHNESRKHEDMNQTQLYATAANLFKSCAHEYERHQEMAAAALSYKCMEVAYMRVVYCKHPSTNMDRHELQTTLQMVSQGESSSSSASDIDNLNNQTAVYKATFPVATNNLVSGNQVISAQTRPNLVRLLDFTQDINFAMEASGKCQSAFAAANVNMEEARHKDCIKSIRRVIDFSFQDADELVHLVLMATNAIRLAGLGSARD